MNFHLRRYNKCVKYIIYTYIYFECVLILGLWYCRTVISFWTLNYIRTNLKIKLSTSVGLQARARASALSQFMQVSPVLFAVWYETHKLDVNTGYGAVLFSFLLFLFSQNDSHFIGNSFFFPSLLLLCNVLSLVTFTLIIFRKTCDIWTLAMNQNWNAQISKISSN